MSIPGLARRDVGPLTIAVLVLAPAVLWVAGRPAGEPAGSFAGQLLGAESVLLLSVGLVLISTLPWVEVWFEGIDRAAVWHRRVAITGLVLLLPHVLLSSNPAGGTALGGYTSRLGDILEPGMPAVIGGPHGRFDHSKGTDRQVWIAGGVGVAPFLSWLRDLDGHLPRRVDFFYATDGEPPFAEEIHAIAGRHPSLSAHLVDSVAEGRLTAERVLEVAAAPPPELSVFMCGPQGMLRALGAGLRRAGVRGRNIHREYFDWR